MPIVTLTTDLGKDTHQVAKVKMQLMHTMAGAHVVDISHNITPFAIDEAVYLVSSSIADFPPGTLHLVSVDIDLFGYRRLLACLYKEQVFISSDNGFFSLLVKDEPAQFYELPLKDSDLTDPFPLKNILVPIAAEVAARGIQNSGTVTEKVLEKILERPIVAENELRGHVIYVNNYCNAITNITRNDFENARNGRYFEIMMNRFDRITQLSNTAGEAPEGECLCFFNEDGLLEIAVNRGKASQLLGLEKGKMITVEFFAEAPKSAPKVGRLL